MVNQEVRNVDSAFRVYGDNILETELIIEWAMDEKSGLEFKQRVGPVDRPIFLFTDRYNENSNYAFQLCPGYDRWQNDPLEGVFSEQPDIFLTKVLGSEEDSDPILAIESCDAVQAGNQAWQRFRRADDAAENGVPYLYLIPLIDWEHQVDGFELKNPRYQSAQITLGQLALCSQYGIPSLQIYELTSWCDYAFEEDYPLPDDYENFQGASIGIEYVFALLRAEADVGGTFENERESSLRKILKEMLQVAKRYSDYKSTELPVHLEHPVLTNNISEIVDVYSESIASGSPVDGDVGAHNISIEDFEADGTIFRKAAQKRTCSDEFYEEILEKVNWKDSANKGYKIDYLSTWGIDVSQSRTSDELDALVRDNFGDTPVGYKDPPSEAVVIGNREEFRNIMDNAYPDLDEEILNWIYTDGMEDPLLFIPLYGYKPSGDSRPDRGLLSLLVSLFPNIATKRNLFVIMYSKRTPEDWENILNRGGNELWNVIDKYAGAIVADVTKSGVILSD